MPNDDGEGLEGGDGGDVVVNGEEEETQNTVAAAAAAQTLSAAAPTTSAAASTTMAAAPTTSVAGAVAAVAQARPGPSRMTTVRPAVLGQPEQRQEELNRRIALSKVGFMTEFDIVASVVK